METNIQDSFDYLRGELKKLKNSPKTKDRVEFLKIMKTLLGFLLEWNAMREQDEVKKMIKEYQKIIEDYNLYYHLAKQNQEKQQAVEAIPDEIIVSEIPF